MADLLEQEDRDSNGQLQLVSLVNTYWKTMQNVYNIIKWDEQKTPLQVRWIDFVNSIKDKVIQVCTSISRDQGVRLALKLYYRINSIGISKTYFRIFCLFSRFLSVYLECLQNSFSAFHRTYVLFRSHIRIAFRSLAGNLNKTMDK